MRVTFGAVALIAIAAAAFFVIRSEGQIATLTSSARGFDLHAREAAGSCAELRAGIEAYVAAGQGVAFWTSTVATITDRAKAAVKSLRVSARGAAGRQALMEAEATLADFEHTEKRIREYLKTGDRLMAADVIFAEGGDRAATAGRQVETARLAELQALDADETELRRQQAAALAAAAAVAAVAVLLLVPIHGQAPSPAPQREPLGGEPAAPVVQLPPKPKGLSVLQVTAELCTEFGRVRDIEDLKRILARAADIMEAKGLIVWLGSTDGADLQPIVAHGYSAETMARLPRIRRSGDNAAAAAYRTGVQQIVLSRPDQMCDAVVAPILAVDGCIGALSAEMREGTKGSEAVQMLTTIVASQLAGLFAATADANVDSALRIAD